MTTSSDKRALKPYTKYERATMWLVPGDDEAVAPFYVARDPITWRQYTEFNPGAAPPDADLDAAAIGLSWDAAAAYCGWWAEVAAKAFRLPTAAEWAWAIRPSANHGLRFAERVTWEWTQEALPPAGMSVSGVAFRVVRSLR